MTEPKRVAYRGREIVLTTQRHEDLWVVDINVYRPPGVVPVYVANNRLFNTPEEALAYGEEAGMAWVDHWMDSASA